MSNIKNKTALVTGGANGIGYMVVKQLLKNGAKRVAILDLIDSKGPESVATFEAEFGEGRAVFYPCDVSKADEFTETIQEVKNAFKYIDIFVNNAGILKDKLIEKTIEINVIAVMRGTLLAIQHMSKNNGGKGGTIVNVSSKAGIHPYFSNPVYCGSKFAVLGFSKSLEFHTEKIGVRILVICPGITNTNIVFIKSETFLDIVDPKEVDQYHANVPRQEADDVALAMMDLIEHGKNGATMVVEKGESSHPVNLQCLELQYQKL